MINSKLWTGVLLAGVVATGVSMRVTAEEPAPAADAAAPAPAAKQPSPEEMEAWAKAAAPGPQHEQLAKYVGEFTAEFKMWMDPTQPPMASTGKQINEMIMGGRFLAGHYEGEMMGQTFHGKSITGYDNTKQKHFSAWIDDMSTGLMVAEGSADESGKVIELTGEMPCPAAGNTIQKFREVTKFVDDDTYMFEMFMTGPDGQENQSMQITYRRVK